MKSKELLVHILQEQIKQTECAHRVALASESMADYSLNSMRQMAEAHQAWMKNNEEDVAMNAELRAFQRESIERERARWVSMERLPDECIAENRSAVENRAAAEKHAPKAKLHVPDQYLIDTEGGKHHESH